MLDAVAPLNIVVITLSVEQKVRTACCTRNLADQNRLAACNSEGDPAAVADDVVPDH